jgi:hypothetical protein
MAFDNGDIPNNRLSNVIQDGFGIARYPVTIDPIRHHLKFCFRSRTKCEALDELPRLAGLQFAADCDSGKICPGINN